VKRVVEELREFGPDRIGPGVPPPMGTESARAWCAALASGHYENFSVLSALVPERLRGDFAAVFPVVRWLVVDRVNALDKKIDAVDAKHTASAQGQGKRIGDGESWMAAHDAVESERRRVREDTRGIPVVDEGRKGRGR
jgi:phytoene/squalene synthetase